jgi:hypothetical protein
MTIAFEQEQRHSRAGMEESVGRSVEGGSTLEYWIDSC